MYRRVFDRVYRMGRLAAFTVKHQRSGCTIVRQFPRRGAPPRPRDGEVDIVTRGSMARNIVVLGGGGWMEPAWSGRWMRTHFSG